MKFKRTFLAMISILLSTPSFAVNIEDLAKIVAIQQSQIASLIPSGTIMAYAGASAPKGWIFAYGQELDSKSNSRLFAAIGRTYCTPNHGGICGENRFRLPDLRGRDIRGRDNMGGASAGRVTASSTIEGTMLGNAGGDQLVTLASANIPAVSASYTPTGQIPSGGGHTHYFDIKMFSPGAGNYDAGFVVHHQDLIGWTSGGMETSSSHSEHSHSFNGTRTDITVGSGTPSAINNLPPTVVMNYIIKM